MKRVANKPTLTGFATSGVGGLKPPSQTRTYLSGQVQAKRLVIPALSITEQTDIHALNPRNQSALTSDAVRDILPSIIENGVHVEGVAIRCSETGKLLLLDASRRRFCCIEAKVDLPLWELQGEISDDQALAIINDSQEVKKWSYPEHANYLLTVAARKKLMPDSMKIDDLAKALSIGRESLRKRLEAAHLDTRLRNLFPDYEGIPNAFYARLAKVERTLTKAGKTVTDFIEYIKQEVDLNEKTLSVSEQQAKIMAALESKLLNFIGQRKTKREWKSEILVPFEDKKMFARVSKSPDRNITKFEFSRIESDKLKKIETYITAILNEKD